MLSRSALTSLECLICRFSYSSKNRRPQVLPCGHSLCSTCIQNYVEQDGKIQCPYDQIIWPANNITDFPTNHYLLELVGESEITCTRHSSEPASWFSKLHLQALCGKYCTPHDDSDLWTIPVDGPKIRNYLSEQLNQVPSDFPFTESSLSAKRSPDNVTLDQLLMTVLWTKVPSCHCSPPSPGKYVDMTTLTVYCNNCKEEWVQAEELLITSDFNDKVVKVIFEALKWVHFYHLKAEHISFFSAGTQVGNYAQKDLFAIGQEIMSFRGKNKLETSEYPEMVYCPGCSEQVSKQELRMRQLPCANAIHAVCEQCLDKQRDRSICICPIDHNTFLKDIYHLEPLIGRNRILTDYYLAGKGYLLPFFKCRENCKAFDLFVDVLPSRTGLYIDENDPFASFNQPWKANSLPNQVECITFRLLSGTVIIRGFGIGSKLNETQEAIISSVKLYRNEHAAGPSFQDIPLQSSQLGREQPLCTDIYFQNGVKVTSTEIVTLKIKIAPADRIVELFHGNHLGAYETPQGGEREGTTFEVLPTKSLDPGERLAGSNCLSPLLRLIYESSA